MKKLFLVEKTDYIDWDEYDSCVIVADNEEEVHKMIDNKNISAFGDKYKSYFDNGKSFRRITEINLNAVDSCLLCSSFNAG